MDNIEHKPLLTYDIRSAMEVSQNPYQGDYKRVLCVCSAGVLRSATTAVVLSQEPFNYNTRSAGVEHYALTPITLPLLFWAEEIVCMTKEHEMKIKALLEDKPNADQKKIICLNIPDSYEYRNEDLMKMIKENYERSS